MIVSLFVLYMNKIYILFHAWCAYKTSFEKPNKDQKLISNVM